MRLYRLRNLGSGGTVREAGQETRAVFMFTDKPVTADYEQVARGVHQIIVVIERRKPRKRENVWRRRTG